MRLFRLAENSDDPWKSRRIFPDHYEEGRWARGTIILVFVGMLVSVIVIGSVIMVSCALQSGLVVQVNLVEWA